VAVLTPREVNSPQRLHNNLRKKTERRLCWNHRKTFKLRGGLIYPTLPPTVPPWVYIYMHMAFSLPASSCPCRRHSDPWDDPFGNDAAASEFGSVVTNENASQVLGNDLGDNLCATALRVVQFCILDVCSLCSFLCVCVCDVSFISSASASNRINTFTSSHKDQLDFQDWFLNFQKLAMEVPKGGRGLAAVRGDGPRDKASRNIFHFASAGQVSQ
jgi:hypothetical protein